MEDVLLELQKSVLKKKKKRRNRIAYSSLSRWESASYDGLRWLRLLVLLILDEQQQIALFLLLFFLHFFQKLLASFLFFYLIEPSRYSPSSLLCRFPFCRQKASLFSPFLGYPFPAVTRLSAIVTKNLLASLALRYFPVGSLNFSFFADPIPSSRFFLPSLLSLSPFFFLSDPSLPPLCGSPSLYLFILAL